MHHLHFNHLAVIVSGIFLWCLGAAWYSPLTFSRPWVAMLGLQRDPSRRGSIFFAMFASLVGDLLVAFVLAHIILWSGADTVGWGIFVGFICWLGFIAAPSYPQGIYEHRPFGVFAINAGYWLVGLLACGGVLAVWR
jgi:hypothetical protein